MPTPNEEMVGVLYRSGVRYVNMAKRLKSSTLFTYSLFWSLAQTHFSRREPQFITSTGEAYKRLMDRFCPHVVQFDIHSRPTLTHDGLQQIVTEGSYKGIIGLYYDSALSHFHFSDPTDAMMFKLQVG